MMPWEVMGGLDAVLHVLFASIAMIVIFPRRNRVPYIIAMAVIMEIVIDGAHAFNKAYTHNVFFLFEVPLLLLFAGYVLRDSRIAITSVLLFANNFTHLVMDLFYEGDSIPLYYPFISGEFELGASQAGFPRGVVVWLMVILLLAILSRMAGFTRFRSPPPYPSGR